MAKKKPLVGTWYAVQAIVTAAWLFINREADLAWSESFSEADLWRDRHDAVKEGLVAMTKRASFRIVPVRCRALTSKKKNPKRTR